MMIIYRIINLLNDKIYIGKCKNLMKRWKPCLHGMTIYVNPDFLKPEEYFEIPEPTILSNNIIIKDSIELKIPFKSGQTGEDTTIFLQM